MLLKEDIQFTCFNRYCSLWKIFTTVGVVHVIDEKSKWSNLDAYLHGAIYLRTFLCKTYCVWKPIRVMEITDQDLYVIWGENRWTSQKRGRGIQVNSPSMSINFSCPPFPLQLSWLFDMTVVMTCQFWEEYATATVRAK